MLEWSKETAEIDKALVALQAELGHAPKTSVNPHFKSKYADFATCKDTAREPLRKNSLAVLQNVVTDLERHAVGVQSRLVHPSSQWYQGIVWCVPRDLSPQSVGAAATYLKRQGFCAILGLSADDDDDGNATSSTEKPGAGSQMTQKEREARQERQAPKGYDPKNPVNVAKLIQALEDHNTPTEHWEHIMVQMTGRPMSDVAMIAERVASTIP